MPGDRLRIEMDYSGNWCHVLYMHAARREIVLDKTYDSYSQAVAAAKVVVTQMAGRRA